MIKKLITITLLGSFLITGSVLAGDEANTAGAEAVKEKSTNSAVIDKIKAELKTMFGGEEPDNVTKSAFPGMYEVTLGTEIVYVSEDTKYLFYGNLIDRENRIDLTRQAKENAEKAYSVTRKAIMDKQDATKTIAFKAKDEKQVLKVFTDIDCPYCAKLHNEVPKLNAKGITIEYYLFPRAGVGSASYKKAVSAWCADDNLDALTKAKNRESIPAKECENPIASQYKLGQEIGVTGTPALVTANGTLIPGYMPADALIARLNSENEEKSKEK